MNSCVSTLINETNVKYEAAALAINVIKPEKPQKKHQHACVGELHTPCKSPVCTPLNLCFNLVLQRFLDLSVVSFFVRLIASSSHMW